MKFCSVAAWVALSLGLTLASAVFGLDASLPADRRPAADASGQSDVPIRLAQNARPGIAILTGPGAVSQFLDGLLALPEPGPAPPPGLDLPASFTGDLTCRECGNMRYRLNLWPDRVYALKRRSLASKQSLDSIGRWSTRDNGRTMVLEEPDEELRFQVRAPDHLRLIGHGKVTIPPVQTAELAGKPGITPLDLKLPLKGMVSFLAENARITECRTGRDYPLAPDEDFETLEAAYLASGVPQGTPLMASFDGAITQRALSSGEGSETVVVVQHFTGVWPDETCEKDRSDLPLEGTRWKVVRLGRTEITAIGGREPCLMLKPEERRFVATVGCNQLMGEFVHQGNSLTFKLAASTKMACPPPLDDWEAQLTLAFAQTMSWRVNGQALELLDSSGMQIALFEAETGP